MLRFGTAVAAEAESMTLSGPDKLGVLEGGGSIGDAVAKESEHAASSVVFWSSAPVVGPGSVSGCLGGEGPISVVILPQRAKRAGNWKWEVRVLQCRRRAFDGGFRRFHGGERPDKEAIRDDLATGQVGFGPMIKSAQ